MPSKRPNTRGIASSYPEEGITEKVSRAALCTAANMKKTETILIAHIAVDRMKEYYAEPKLGP